MAKLSLATIISAYACKYGELAIGEFPFSPSPTAAVLMVAVRNPYPLNHTRPA